MNIMQALGEGSVKDGRVHKYKNLEQKIYYIFIVLKVRKIRNLVLYNKTSTLFFLENQGF